MAGTLLVDHPSLPVDFTECLTIIFTHKVNGRSISKTQIHLNHCFPDSIFPGSNDTYPNRILVFRNKHLSNHVNTQGYFFDRGIKNDKEVQYF